MSRYHMGINLGHERSVAIVRDGEILVAIEQERLDRNKFSLGYLLQSPGDAAKMQLPQEAMQYCLEACDIRLEDLATITGNMPGQDFAPAILRRSVPRDIAAKVQQIPSHHLAHAYSAYWPSGFDDAIVLVADASGTTVNHQTESYSLYTAQSSAQGSQLSLLHSETVTAHLAGLSTLGFLYEYVTRKAGFVTTVGDQIKHAESGKLMGLAPFGSEQPNLQRWIHTQPGSYSLKIAAYDIFLEIAALEKHYDTGEGKPYLRPYLVDLAYKVQHELEQALLHVVGLAVENTGLRRLCVAGGVGLNSVANYKLLQNLKLDDIFIFPAAGDGGIAAGCALWANHAIGHSSTRHPLTQAGLGKAYEPDQVKQAIGEFAGDIIVEELSDAEMLVRSAQALARGSIVARFSGGCEYGPRALGHRSIMADPTFLRMKDIVNARVKFREAFRPFAPVIPLESITEVFEQSVAAPFMLVVPAIKPEFHSKIPAVTHVDGTGRVQTVTAEHNPYFYQLCHQLVVERQGVPVLLNTSFNIAGQPIVETPAEAIDTFLGTDIDFLAIENFWIAKRHVPVLDYDAHLGKVGDSPTPHGLMAPIPIMTNRMQQLDQALFGDRPADCPWSTAELLQLSSQGGKYKETSRLFPTVGLAGLALQTHLSDRAILLLDPMGQSALVDLSARTKPTTYSLQQVKLLLTLLTPTCEAIQQRRIESRQTEREFQIQLDWATERLQRYGLTANTMRLPLVPDSALPNGPLTGTKTFAPFEDETFCATGRLRSFYQCLQQANYSEAHISELLQVTSLQQIEPTRLHYYDRHRLPESPIGDLIRLFQLRVALPQARLQTLFGDALWTTLVSLGVLVKRDNLSDNLWSSRVDIFDVNGLYIATDHRYMVLPEDRLDESPVMYIGMDSMGLVHTAPQLSADRVLDLCCGSGIQGLIASRYARQVISVDINPRALRFSRFNAQLNGIDNIEFRLGNLYQAVAGEFESGHRFDTILANPPFVPSPKQEFHFRDGGATGEEILAAIVKDSGAHLTPTGRLFIVTDLVDISRYETKLERWWNGGMAHKLVLGTADRDDILFSVPHSHAAFGQSFEAYNAELEQWIGNFHGAGLKAVNFGYILIQRATTLKLGSYYRRTIHNPSTPIHTQVATYFQQRQHLEMPGQLQLAMAPGICFQMQLDPSTGETQTELSAPDNSYYTTYPISPQMVHLLQEIRQQQPQWRLYATPANREILQDLVCKGILQLVAQPAPTAVLLPQLGQLATLSPGALANGNVNGSYTSYSNGNSRAKAMTATNELSIAELQTKTTPTCLSSYL